MPAMIRRALVLLAVISLLLCAFWATLLVRSIWRHDRVQARIAGRPYVLTSQLGRLSFWWGSETAADFSAAWYAFKADEVDSLQPWEGDGPGPVSRKWDAAGFAYA